MKIAHYVSFTLSTCSVKLYDWHNSVKFDKLLYKKLLNWKVTKRSEKNFMSCQKTMANYMKVHFNPIENVLH